MFGTLKPHRCTLDDAAYSRYRTYYCGLCQGLGRHVGPLGRAALSRDAVLVAILADALQESAAPDDTTRCPMMPLGHQPTRTPGAPAMEAATGLQLLLGDQKLADRALEGGRAARVIRRWAAGPVARARTDLVALGVPVDRLDGFEHTQLRVEVPGVTGPARAARPTAEALGLVFAALADLPGTAVAVRTAETRETLRALGRAVGRVIYLVDAFEDLDRDRRKGEFNPLLVRRDGTGSWLASRPRVRRSCIMLDGDLATIRESVETLPLVRNRTLLENILCERLGTTARQAAGVGRTVACGKEPAAAPPPTGPWTARWMAAAAVLLFAALGVAQRAAAAVPGWRTTLLRSLFGWLRTTEADTPEDGTPADGDGAGDGEGGDGGGGSGGGGSCEDAMQSIADAIRDCCDGCCGVCGSCGDPCRACGDSCASCCDGCGDCSADCTSCCDDCSDCGNCCDDCDDCGNCCNDCGDCGDGCNDCNC